jgi:hypothetical protein
MVVPTLTVGARSRCWLRSCLADNLGLQLSCALLEMSIEVVELPRESIPGVVNIAHVNRSKLCCLPASRHLSQKLVLVINALSNLRAAQQAWPGPNGKQWTRSCETRAHGLLVGTICCKGCVQRQRMLRLLQILRTRYM